MKTVFLCFGMNMNTADDLSTVISFFVFIRSAFGCPLNLCTLFSVPGSLSFILYPLFNARPAQKPDAIFFRVWHEN